MFTAVAHLLGRVYAAGANMLTMEKLVANSCNALDLGLERSEVPQTKPGFRESLFPSSYKRALL